MRPPIKSLFSVTLILATSTTHAQSTVTLYGVVDNGILYQNTSASSFSPKASNNGAQLLDKDGGMYPSFLGIKGSEEIGGGIRVNFRLESAFNSNSGQLNLSDTAGTTSIFNQQATIGISGSFGTFDVGRQFAPMVYAMADTDVRAGSYYGSILTAMVSMSQVAGWSGSSTNLPIGALFDSNALVYQSPKWYGASFALEYALGGVPGQAQGGSRESAVIKYSDYGLNVSAVYYNGHDTNPLTAAVPTGLNNNRFYYLGTMYRYRGISVSGSYGVGKNPSDSAHVNIELISGGLGYQVSPFFSLTSGYYYLRDRNNSSNHSSEYIFGATYSLSKKTITYLDVGYVNNHGTMNQSFSLGVPVAPRVPTTSAMIGIRHTF